MRLLIDEKFGLVRPSVDAHTLGTSYVAKLLRECGYSVMIADRRITDAINEISNPSNFALLVEWLKGNRITRLGLSYRLDPAQAVETFDRLYSQLKNHQLIGDRPGSLRGVYFAGLPEACDRVRRQFENVQVFCGDESPAETLGRLGVPSGQIPGSLLRQSSYDDFRLSFATGLIKQGGHLHVQPENRSGYQGYNTSRDLLYSRVLHARLYKQSPLMRAHVGPYNKKRLEAVEEFTDWMRQLSRAGFLDVVSIGTSQLTQERFGEDWQGLPNGGGVPINSEEEYRQIWQAARPMLVRTYAGTKRIPELARIHESTLNIAWHALSFWWFSQIDGRGPNPVYKNLCEHLETLDYIAKTGKPFEPNIPHHFSFRGADDVTYVLSGLLAAKTAKQKGIRHFVLQNMLNTPKYTLGVQDLAKSRAMLQLVRELQDKSFNVILQPRAGLDYFSPDLEKAKVQLAAVSMMMDDIEPDNASSPDAIHVVSYSEASHLATPPIINESVQITRHSITQYRALLKGGVPPYDTNDVKYRTETIVKEVRMLIAAIENGLPDPYSPEGLYRIFAAGFLAAPYMWEGRDEFRHAVGWKTDVVQGGVSIVDDDSVPVSIDERLSVCVHRLMSSLHLSVPFIPSWSPERNVLGVPEPTAD